MCGTERQTEKEEGDEREEQKRREGRERKGGRERDHQLTAKRKEEKLADFWASSAGTVVGGYCPTQFWGDLSLASA